MNYKPLNPEYKQVIKKVLEGQHFMKHVGIEMEACLPGKVVLKLRLSQEHMQQANFVHGGVTSTLCDIAMGFSALTLVAKGKGMVTADLHISYHRPAQGNEIWVEAHVAKAGTTLFFCEAKVYTLDEELIETDVAKAFSTMCATTIAE